MASLNPMQLIMMLKQGNPQTVAMQIIQSNFSNNPNMLNLLQMAQNGNVTELEQYARQIANSKGLDYDTEMNNLKAAIRNM